MTNKLKKNEKGQTFVQDMIVENNQALTETIQKAVLGIQIIDKIIREMADYISQAITRIPPELAEFLSVLPENSKLFLEKIIGACETLAEAGWTVPMELAPSELFELLDSLETTRLDEYFFNFYTANDNAMLNEVFSDIQEHDNKWKSLIDECISAYKKEYYLIIVPSLLSVIEGLLSILMLEFISNGKRKKEGVIDVCKRMASGEDRYKNVIWISLWKLIERLFQSANFNAERPALINRHWILHGRDETNWGKIDAIRLFTTVRTLLVALRRTSY